MSDRPDLNARQRLIELDVINGCDSGFRLNERGVQRGCHWMHDGTGPPCVCVLPVRHKDLAAILERESGEPGKEQP